jgi:hypothetical protein
VKVPEPARFVVDFPTLFVALDWVPRHCVIPDGFRKGQPFVPLRWQDWCLANFYRVKPTAIWVPDNPVLGSAFHYRRSQIMLPQKAGKGPYTATHICIEAVGPALFAGWAQGGEVWDCEEHGCPCGWVYQYEPGEPMGMPWPTPLIQLTATSEKQTDNVYRLLRPMIDNGRLSEVIPKTGEEFIRLPNDGRIDVVTASADSKLGQQVTFVPQDETGIWTRQNKMVDVADTQRRGAAGMGGRIEETTNAFDPAASSVGQRTFESKSKDIFRYRPVAPANLSYTDKRERRQIHRIVYADSLRENGGHVDLDSIEAEAAEMADTDPAKAERFFGNRTVAGARQWIPSEFWTAQKEAGDILDGEWVALGFDGSINDDWTALTASRISDGKIMLLQVWRPPPGAEPGTWQVPVHEVRAAFRDAFRRFRVALFYGDPHEWRTEIGDLAEEHGEGDLARVREFDTHVASRIGPAVDRFKTDIVTERLKHTGDPVTTECIDNARAAQRGRYTVIEKETPRSQKKIDAAMTALIAYQARNDAIELGLAGVKEYGVYSSSNW